MRSLRGRRRDGWRFCGGGVLTGLQELNFYDSIEAIYAGSAGAMNAAYFLSGQTELGASIYFDDLTHDFILPGNIPIGIAKLLWSRYALELPRDKTRYTVNIDYVMDLISRRKRLMSERVNKKNVDFYVKLFNVKTGEIEYLNAKQNDLYAVLRAACCCAPHYPFSQNIGNNRYMDGTIAEPIGLQYLLDKYPERKIVVIMNSFLKRRFVHRVRCFFEGLVGEFCDYPLFKIYMNRENSLREDLKLALAAPHVLLICPPPGCPAIAMTRDKKELMEAFEIGKRQADKIRLFFEKTPRFIFADILPRKD